MAARLQELGFYARAGVPKTLRELFADGEAMGSPANRAAPNRSSLTAELGRLNTEECPRLSMPKTQSGGRQARDHDPVA
jgi:hypothetical protein